MYWAPHTKRSAATELRSYPPPNFLCLYPSLLHQLCIEYDLELPSGCEFSSLHCLSHWYNRFRGRGSIHSLLNWRWRWEQRVLDGRRCWAVDLRGFGLRNFWGHRGDTRGLLVWHDLMWNIETDFLDYVRSIAGGIQDVGHAGVRCVGDVCCATFDCFRGEAARESDTSEASWSHDS